MQTRNVECRSLPEKGTGMAVSESLCPNNTRPAGTRPCSNEQPCATWEEGEWGEVCGGRESGERCVKGGRVGRGVWRDGEWGEVWEGEWREVCGGRESGERCVEGEWGERYVEGGRMERGS